MKKFNGTLSVYNTLFTVFIALIFTTVYYQYFRRPYIKKLLYRERSLFKGFHGHAGWALLEAAMAAGKRANVVHL